MSQLQLYYLHTFFGGRYLSDTTFEGGESEKLIGQVVKEAESLGICRWSISVILPVGLTLFTLAQSEASSM